MWFEQELTKNRLILDFNSLEQLSDDAAESSQLAIEHITSKYKPPYLLFLSGGIDSQAMVLAWKRSKVPFSVIHYSYSGSMNDEDTTSAKNFCATHDIPLSIKTFNALEFIISPRLAIEAKRYTTISPQILSYIQLVKQHPDTCIFGGNFLEPANCSLNYTILGLDRFANKDKYNFIPFFFQSTPQLAYSFIKKYILMSKNHHSQYENYDIKIKTYKESGFDVIPQSSKLSGFEKIKESFDNAVITPKTKLRWYSKPSRRPFDILYRYSLFDTIGYEYSDNVRLIHDSRISDYMSSLYKGFPAE